MDDVSIRAAVTAWIDNPTAAAETYGEIGTWCTADVTDMSFLFCEWRSWMMFSVDEWSSCVLPEGSAFNDDIGDWVVSAVTDMSNMFALAETFN